MELWYPVKHKKRSECLLLIQYLSEVMLLGGFLFDRLLNLENATCP